MNHLGNFHFIKHKQKKNSRSIKMDGAVNIDFDRWAYELWYKLTEHNYLYAALEKFRSVEIPADCQRASIVAMSAYNGALRFLEQPIAEGKEATFREASRSINEFGRLIKDLAARVNSS